MNSFVWIFIGLLFNQATSQIIPPTSIGVNFGTNGNNLPYPQDVINLYERCKIQQMRLYEPNGNILEALRHSGLSVSLGVKNEDIPNLANFNDPNACIDWLSNNVVPFKDDVTFNYITMGNEAIPGPLAQYLPGAMNNMNNALTSLSLGKIKVTTVVGTTVLENSFPPSAGEFSTDSFPIMGDIISFLYGNNIPLMVNVYPYFTYASDPHIPLAYATFLSKTPYLVDEQFLYYNFFDAMIDSFNAAIEKVNAGNVSLAISETGWPSAGNYGPCASKEVAKIYNTNLVNHVMKNGTPRRPLQIMNTFISAMFNENMKSAGEEQNFGLFYPNMESVYHLFSC